MCIPIYMYVCVCIPIYMYTYVCMHIHTYICVYTYILSKYENMMYTYIKRLGESPFNVRTIRNGIYELTYKGFSYLNRIYWFHVLSFSP